MLEAPVHPRRWGLAWTSQCAEQSLAAAGQQIKPSGSQVVSQFELRRTVHPRHRERSVAIQGHKTDSSCVNTGIATAPSGASR